MKKLLSLLAVLTLAVATMGISTCATTGSSILSNPAVQAEIAAAEQIALHFAEQWITTGKLGATRSLRSSGAQSQMAKAKATIKANYPNMPDNMINDIVAAKFAGL